MGRVDRPGDGAGDDNQAARRLLFDPARGRPRRITTDGAELTVDVVVPEARR